MVWELVGAGAVRALHVQGQDCLPFATSPPIPDTTTAINIGSLPPGNYEIHIRMVGPGSFSDASRGSIVFSVGQAAALPIPSLSTLGLALLALAVLGLTWSQSYRA